MVPSDSSSTEGSRPGSAARSHRPTIPPREGEGTTTSDAESAKRTLTLPEVASTNLASQASQEFLADTSTGALSPTSIRFLPSALPFSTTGAAAAASVPEEPQRFHSSAGDVRDQGDRDGEGGWIQSMNPSVMKPQPKPRKDVQRSASMASPDISASVARRFPLLEKTPTDLDLIKLTDTIEDASIHEHPPKIPPKPEDLEPLLPHNPPPVPDRTYLSPTHSPNSKMAPVNGSKSTPTKPHFDNPLAAEFPDADEEMCRRALEYHGSNIEKARQEVQVQILLGMRIPHTDANDCRRALTHCQGKIDRAASWLVERNLNVEDRRV